MDTEMRRNIIVEFVAKHQGCTAQIIVDGVKDKMSRTLVFSTLKGLLQDRIVEDNKLNRRNHRYFVNTSNLLYSVTHELNEFEARLLRWVESMKVKYTSQIVLAKKTNLTAHFHKAQEIDIEAWYGSKTIVADVVNTYTREALSSWSKQSKDREFLEKLYATAFSKFQRIISRLSRIIPFSENERPETIEGIRQFRGGRRDFEAFEYLWEKLRTKRLNNTEFDDLMEMVWNAGQHEYGLDENMRVGWKDVLENPDKY
ncbi:MAG: hypothetical protein M3P08_00450 [Thermoproteota archaeon]|nr:hypothetical protein [Thermoproteota archaeon]